MPEFGEEEALAAADESELLDSPESALDEEFSLDNVDLPELEEVEPALEEAMVEEVPSEETAVEETIVEEAAPEPIQEAAAEAPESDLEAATEEEFNFDDLPEFGEEEALAAAGESELLDSPESSLDEEFSFENVDLPELEDVEPAIDEPLEEERSSSESPAVESLEPPQEPALNTERETDPLESGELPDDISINDDDLPEFGEEEALDEAIADEFDLSNDFEREETPQTNYADDDVAISDDDLPSFDEMDALNDLDEGEFSQPPELSLEDNFGFDKDALPSLDDEEPLNEATPTLEPESQEPEQVESADADPASDEFDFTDQDLPEFGEDDALEAVGDEFSEEADDSDFNLQNVDLPSLDKEPEATTGSDTLDQDEEQDALFDVLASESAFDEVEAEILHQEFDESTMANLLSEDGLEDDPIFSGELDQDTVASAGMDFDAMLDVGGEDWNGFTLSPDQQAEISTDVPEEEQAVWQSQEALQQPSVDEENWENQEDLSDFDPQKSQFMTIDELMAQVEGEEANAEEQEQDLKLDVGLNEFPDVIGDVGGDDVDVDSDAEAAGKVDLAKIYLEMNDPEGAVKLLEEAIVYGDDETRREAKNLIDAINRQ